jgi:hypothetical protein
MDSEPLTPEQEADVTPEDLVRIENAEVIRVAASPVPIDLGRGD